MKSRTLIAALFAFMVVAPGQASAASVPVVHDLAGYGHSSVRPRALWAFTGDGSMGLIRLRWTHWRASSAFAGGTLYYRSCWGSCFKPGYVPVKVGLYAAQRYQGQSYFSRVYYHFWWHGVLHTNVAVYSGSKSYGYWRYTSGGWVP